MNVPRRTPKTEQVLTRWVDAYAREHGQPPARVRSWVSYMVLGGALERAGFSGTGPRFTIKGGVALELRLRSIARATKDLDLILNNPAGELVEELETALALPYEGFSFRRKGEPEFMPNAAVRVEIALQYNGKSWGTVQVDLARCEADSTGVEMVEAISLEPFGLRGPETLPCLSLPYHVAQKIHAMTCPPPLGRRNDRFRDLVDLLLLQEWITDYDSVRAACQAVFAHRNSHPWPPFFEPPEHWEEPFARMAAELNLPVTELFQAAAEFRHFLHSIDDSAPLLPEVVLDKTLSATTWYFAVGKGFAFHRLPSRIGETLIRNRRPEEVPIRPEWQLQNGGLLVVGVVVFLANRDPWFIDRCRICPVALTDALDGVEVGVDDEEIWRPLADRLLRLAKAPQRAAKSLALYMSQAQGILPCEIAVQLGITSDHAHRNYSGCDQPKAGGRLLWDLRKSRLAKWVE